MFLLKICSHNHFPHRRAQLFQKLVPFCLLIRRKVITIQQASNVRAIPAFKQYVYKNVDVWLKSCEFLFHYHFYQLSFCLFENDIKNSELVYW